MLARRVMRQWCIAFSVVIVAAGLTLHPSMAQPDPSTMIPASATVTPETLPSMPASPTLAPELPTAIPASPSPSPELPTATLVSPTLVPELPTIPPASPTFAPEPPSVPLVSPTPAPELPTATISPLDFVPESPALMPASITLQIEGHTSIQPGDSVDIRITGEYLADVYGFSAECRLDAPVLSAIAAIPGAAFPPDLSFWFDRGDQGRGVWTFSASLRNPAQPIVGAADLFMLRWLANTPGRVTITCDVLLADREGRSLPVQVQAFSMEIIGEQILSVASPELTPDPAPEFPTEAPPLESNEVPSTDDEAATGYDMPVQPDHISVTGRVQPSAGLPQVQIRIEDRGGLIHEMSSPSGEPFTVHLPPGVYRVSISASHHLPLRFRLMIDTEPITLPPLALVNGDIHPDGVIDMHDAALLAASFEMPRFLPETDLNHDGRVNILDLAILGGNFGMQAQDVTLHRQPAAPNTVQHRLAYTELT